MDIKNSNDKPGAESPLPPLTCSDVFEAMWARWRNRSSNPSEFDKSRSICQDAFNAGWEYSEILRVECERLRNALADAIRRPLGVTPDSAAGLVSMEGLREAEKRRSKEPNANHFADANKKVL